MTRLLRLCLYCAALVTPLPVHNALSQQMTGHALSVRTIYAEPNIDSEVVGELMVGVEVSMVRTGSVFFQIIWPEELRGFVVYPKLDSSVDGEASAEVEAPTEREAASPPVTEPTSTSIRGQLLQPATLRDEPGLFGKVIVRLPKYAEVTVLGRVRNWLLVRTPVGEQIHEGYIHKAMLPSNLEVPQLPESGAGIDDDIAEVQ